VVIPFVELTEEVREQTSFLQLLGVQEVNQSSDNAHSRDQELKSARWWRVSNNEYADASHRYSEERWVPPTLSETKRCLHATQRTIKISTTRTNHLCCFGSV
jgi:hypothetical protein